MRLRTLLSSSGAALLAAMAAPALAQSTEAQRIAELERTLAERQSALNAQAAQLEAQLEQLQGLQRSLQDIQREIAELKGTPVPPPEQAAVTPVGGGLLPSASGCALTTPGQRDLAIRLDNRSRTIPAAGTIEGDPRYLPDLEGCDAAQFASRSARQRGLFGYVRDVRSRLLYDEAATVVPGRPLQSAGIKPTIELGNSSSASLTLSVPFFGRFCETAIPPGDRCSGDSFRPYVLSPYVTLSTPLDSGRGKLVARTFGEPNPLNEPSSLGFASGTSIKIGGDFLLYGRGTFVEAASEMDKLLAEATQACLADLHDKRAKGSLQAVDTSICGPARIVDWILALKADSATTAGFSHAREDLAARLLNVGWRAKKDAAPWIGIGGSFQYGTKDFKFQQASVADVTLDGKTTVVPDFSSGLLGSRTVARDQFDVEGHLLLYHDFDRGRTEPREYTPSPYVPGIMLVPQVTHSSRYEFAPGTALTRCKADPVAQPADCSIINIDRPRHREFTTASAELRWQLQNVPVLDRVGFAPKLSYVLEDEGYTLDFPIYFLKDSKLSAGIRGRYSHDLDDVLRNDLDSELEISLFFSPLTFTGF